MFDYINLYSALCTLFTSSLLKAFIKPEKEETPMDHTFVSLPAGTFFSVQVVR